MEGIMKLFLVVFLFSLIPGAQAYDFKVLSWNVYMLPKPIKQSLQKTRTRVIPEQLKKTDYDLILLQEAFMGSFRKAVSRELMASHPHTYYLKNPYHAPTIFGSGLYVLSKFPMKILGHAYFNNCAAADCFASKGAALMEITLPDDQKIHVMNTHLQATKINGSIRMKQLGQIHSLLARHGRSGVPQFLIGDLNIDDDDPQFLLGLAFLGMDYARLVGPVLQTSGRKNPCYKVSGKPSWVDHMWFANYAGISASNLVVKNFEFERKGKVCPSSDHHAIEAEFYF